MPVRSARVSVRSHQVGACAICGLEHEEGPCPAPGGLPDAPEDAKALLDAPEDAKALLDAPEDAKALLDAPTIELVAGSRPGSSSATGARPPEPGQPPALELEGRYRVGRLIAAGGMGEVFEGEDFALKRPVAIKFLAARYQSDAELAARFRREAEALALAEHPNIVPVYGIGAHDGRPYFVMKRVQGRTLEELIAASGRLPLPQVVHVGIEACAALERIHALGFVHRDVKPANLMLAPDGSCTLLDFGILRAEESTLTSTGFGIGTPHYIAPEQSRDARLAEPRSDLYSLGATLYAALVGSPPFHGSSQYELVHKHHVESPVPPSSRVEGVPASADAWFERALAKRPEDRFLNAGEMRDELRRLVEPSWGDSEPVPRLLSPIELESTEPTPPRNRSTAAPKADRPAPRHGYRIAAVLSLVALAGSLLFYRLVSRPDSERMESIAVLPLENLSGSADDEYLADGLTEQLTADLARVRTLRVIPRASMTKYKGTRTPIPEIAREIGVDGIIAGSVQRSGSKLRITAELLDGKHEDHLWAETFDRKLDDLLDVEAGIARSIVRRITTRLSAEDDARLSRALAQKVDPQAYQLYLKGLFAANKLSPNSSTEALEYFRQAIGIEPTFARAYVGISDGYYMMANDILPPEEAMPRARAAAQKALELDDTLADAHAALARVTELYDWDPVAAEKSYRRAIDLDPRAAYVRKMYGQYLAVYGRIKEAREEFEKARELDPLSDRIALTAVWVDFCDRRYEDAEKKLMLLVRQNPSFLSAHTVLSMALVAQGRFDEAAKIAEGFAKLDPSGATVPLAGTVYARAGRIEEARALEVKLEAQSKTGWVSTVSMADLYASTGDADRAFEWLEKGVKTRSEELLYLNCNPLLDPIRADPRFRDLERRVGLRR